LLRRGEPLTAAVQRNHVRAAVAALEPLARNYDLVISHGNGPQVGMLAMQAAAWNSQPAYPLDVLDAESEGMIGYLIEQELGNRLPERRAAVLLTQIEVDPDDPAFRRPTKPIGPAYVETEARRMERERGWTFVRDGDRLRRVVASPRPRRILEMPVIEMLVRQGVIVICAGGGGIPVVARSDGSLVGVEAVIDKDLASALLARELKADRFLMLTDVEAVWLHWGQPGARPLRRVTPGELRRHVFAPGSMGPKVEAACEFVERTGGVAGIGALHDAPAILQGEAGTLITPETGDTQFWD
jgi:carbamate kinase